MIYRILAVLAVLALVSPASANGYGMGFADPGCGVGFYGGYAPAVAFAAPVYAPVGFATPYFASNRFVGGSYFNSGFYGGFRSFNNGFYGGGFRHGVGVAVGPFGGVAVRAPFFRGFFR